MTAALSKPTAVEDFREVAMEQLKLATEELFNNYGAELTLVAREEETKRRVNFSLGAAIGFTSPHVRGVLAVAVDDRLAVQINPLADTASDQTDSLDWMGELANQLLGRLKNKLLAYGVELALSTPVVVQGNQLRIGSVRRRALKLSFRNDSSVADVWWDAEVDADLELTESQEDVQEEGDMLLF